MKAGAGSTANHKRFAARFTIASSSIIFAREMQPEAVAEFRVRYAETDQMGVVYHANYLAWCEIGRTEYIRDRGISYAELERRGVMLAVSDLSIRYHSPARYDDVVRVVTTLHEVRSRTITFDYLISDAVNGRRLASARTTLVSIDRNGRPTALPTEVRELFR